MSAQFAIVVIVVCLLKRSLLGNQSTPSMSLEFFLRNLDSGSCHVDSDIEKDIFASDEETDSKALPLSRSLHNKVTMSILVSLRQIMSSGITWTAFSPV